MEVMVELHTNHYGCIKAHLSPLMTTKMLYEQFETVLEGHTLYFRDQKINNDFTHLYELDIVHPCNKLFI